MDTPLMSLLQMISYMFLQFPTILSEPLMQDCHLPISSYTYWMPLDFIIWDYISLVFMCAVPQGRNWYVL